MDLENLSIESISNWQQANAQSAVGVRVLKTANDQTKVAGELITQMIASTPHPQTGKGQSLNITA